MSTECKRTHCESTKAMMCEIIETLLNALKQPEKDIPPYVRARIVEAYQQCRKTLLKSLPENPDEFKVG